MAIYVRNIYKVVKCFENSFGEQKFFIYTMNYLDNKKDEKKSYKKNLKFKCNIILSRIRGQNKILYLLFRQLYLVIYQFKIATRAKNKSIQCNNKAN